MFIYYTIKHGGRVQATTRNFPKARGTAFPFEKIQGNRSAPILSRRTQTFGNMEVSKAFCTTSTQSFV